MTLKQRNRAAAAFGATRLEGRTLELTLKRYWFDLIASGEKREEYRDPTEWILSRLNGKTYDLVRFRNGYAPDAPVCILEYRGWRWGHGKAKWGARMDGEQYIIIKLGRVLVVDDLVLK